MRKRKLYSKISLENALEDMRKNKLSAEKASIKHGVPVRTLRYRCKEKLKGFPNRCLTHNQETSLVQYVKYCAERAFPLTRKMIKAFAREMIIKEQSQDNELTVNVNYGPSNKWFRGFMKRHPELRIRTPDSIDRGRYGMANTTVINNHFQLLEKCLKDMGIMDKPDSIYNVDETGFSKMDKREKVLTERSRKHTYARSVSSTCHITANICVSADGHVLPTFLIFENSFPSGSYRDGVPRDWLFGTSPNGYMDGELFYKWFESVFLPNVHKRPALLVLDNHESHLTLKLLQRAKSENVELYGLPPHTTHVTQPLDVALFKPLKSKFSDIAVNLGYARKDLMIGKAK